MDLVKPVRCEQSAIQKYYAKRVRCYEHVYSVCRPSGLMNNMYRIAWFPLRRIYRYTIQYLSGRTPQCVLDVGCGTGIYSIELARSGSHITGIDSCKDMIEAADELVRSHGLNDRVSTVLADYLEWSGAATSQYDLILAIGVMDSVHDVSTYLTSFKRLAGELILTFPAKSLFSPVTEFSYRKQGFYGYSYTRPHVEELLRTAGFEIMHFQKVFPGTYWVHARRV